MKYVLLGAAGFIGTNLAAELSKKNENKITLVDQNEEYFMPLKKLKLPNAEYNVTTLDSETNFDSILEGKDVVFHLMSTTVPSTTNLHVGEEISANINFTVNLLESCVRNKIKKIVFISSGGTIYGTEDSCPISENAPTDPITAYGIQKLAIEKLMYLYFYMHGLDYRIVRLSNPYGPYQRPNGILGAVTSFTYKALRNEPIIVYGDGSVIRDFIFVEDAVKAIIKIAETDSKHKLFNLGSGQGTSINQLLDTIAAVLNKELKVEYQTARSVDVPVNYLDISRYEEEFGTLDRIDLKKGIQRTAEFLNDNY